MDARRKTERLITLYKTFKTIIMKTYTIICYKLNYKETENTIEKAINRADWLKKKSSGTETYTYNVLDANNTPLYSTSEWQRKVIKTM